MDLPQADPDNAKAEIEDVIGIDATDAIPCSAKTGMGIDEILEAIVRARCRAPRGNPDGAAARDDRRQLVRHLRRRRDAGARGRRPPGQGRAHQDDGDRRDLQRRQPRRLHAGQRAARVAGSRRGRLHHRRHQGTAGRQGRRHRHADQAGHRRRGGHGHRGAAGLQGNPAAGVRRPVPDRGQRVRLAARRAGKAQAQRFVAALRARGQPGAGLRLSLRLPGPAAHGDRAGAARARVRPGPDHDRAQRGLPGA